MGLKLKIFGAFILLIILPLLGLGWVTYTLSERLIEDKYNEQTELTLKAIGRNIRYMFKEANYFSDYYAIIREEMQDMYREMYWRKTPSRESDELNSSFERNIRRTMLTYQPIRSVAMYSNSGSSYAVGALSRQLSFNRLMESPLHPKVLGLTGSPKWIGPKEHPELGVDDTYFYQLRVIKDFYNMKDRGLLILQVDFKELENIFNLYTAGGSNYQRFMLINKEGLVLFDNNKPELRGQNLFQTVGVDLEPVSWFESKRVEFDSRPSMLSFHQLQLDSLGVEGWSVVAVTPLGAISGQMKTIMGWIAIGLSGILGLALIFVFLFVNRIIRFILRVSVAMRKVEHGDLAIRVAAGANDETSVLSRGFNSLVARINELLNEVRREQERKNKAELLLLQAQIKPHFLFNTLESINALATQNEGRKVSLMVRQLSKILRVSIHRDEDVRLMQEIEHLRSYLEIQSYRFENLFEYELDIPDHLMNCRVPKLTLQPLIENSIQHGFEGIGYKGRICVRVRLEKGDLVYYVEDNGIGIAPERLYLFNYAAALNPTGDESALTSAIDECRGLGVGNVAARLRIRYGARYGLFVCSHPQLGTTVKCTIPAVAAKHQQEGNENVESDACR
ncbi:sensor histidine kinase [Paenibacillus sp. GCM10027626]|uniref:cache domain-containing sensor histidine kinase n=1 Tax=Paenibacillus sp. GCM10027626 TaxID=3273411 RepID=UPI0036455C95